MSRSLILDADVPTSLHSGVGGIISLTSAECSQPDISVPGQYQVACDPLFEGEPWHDAPVMGYGREERGLAKLTRWSAPEALAMIRRAIARLPDEGPSNNFWEATPGNVRRFLEQVSAITEWAASNVPWASWRLFG